MNTRALLPDFAGTLDADCILHFSRDAGVRTRRRTRPLPAGGEHDPEIRVAIGRAVIKQAGLKAIRAMLADRDATAALGGLEAFERPSGRQRRATDEAR